MTCFQVFAPFNLDHQVPCVNRTPFLWPVNISVICCWYQISSHSVQWPQLKPLALLLSQCTGVGHQETSCYDFPFLLLPCYIPFHSDHIPLLIFMRLSSFSLSSVLFIDMTHYDSSSPQGYTSPLFPHFLWLCFTMRLRLPFASLLYDSFSLLLDLPCALLFTYKNPCSLASVSLV